MSGILAVFSGQGSQRPGMGRELYDNFASVRRIYEMAGDILGFDVAKASFEGDADTLSRTLVSQPAIFTHSAAACTAAEEIMPVPAAAAGHSLGEFAALWRAEAYCLEDGFKIIKARAAAMDAAANEAPGAMYAIIGLGAEKIAAACENSGGYVIPANFNLPAQTVISGESEAAARAADILAGQGAKTVKLGVSSAFHTKMMAEAARRFQAEISGLAFRGTTLDFYSNLTGKKHVITDYPAYFAAHMVSPVLFADEVAAISEAGLDVCIEFGPGKTVSTLVKKNARGFRTVNVEDLKGLEALGKMLAQ